MLLISSDNYENLPVGSMLLPRQQLHLIWSNTTYSGPQLINFWVDAAINWDKRQIYRRQENADV
jgi:hypothetical protein